MFKFLREKLKRSAKDISEKIDKEGETSEEVVEKVEKKGFFSKIKDKFTKKEEKKENLIEEEKGILEEEKKLEEPPTKAKKTEETEAPAEKEAESQAKEEEQKELEKERLEKEKELERIEKEKEKEEAAKQAEKEPEEKPESKEEVKKDAQKKGILSIIKEKVTTKKISEKQFEDLFWELEIALLENNVAVEVIGKIKQDLGAELVEKPLQRSKLENIVIDTLKISLKDILSQEKLDLLSDARSKKPFVICFVGINGSGKTTTIAKVAHMLKENKLSPVLAAADTFRAASIEQLQKHADNLNIKLIKHDYGSDPAAVAFDAIKHAKSKGTDVVLIDTAGRMHSNSDLLDEMKKIIRVAKPDLKIFVGESITGNDCVEQAKKFNEAIGIDGIILSKADIDEKGGAAVSVSYVTKKPIVYIVVGQEYPDLKPFDADSVVASLGLA